MRHLSWMCLEPWKFAHPTFLLQMGLESLFGGSSSRAQLFTYWKMVLFCRGRSFSSTECTPSGGTHMEWWGRKRTFAESARSITSSLCFCKNLPFLDFVRYTTKDASASIRNWILCKNKEVLKKNDFWGLPSVENFFFWYFKKSSLLYIWHCTSMGF